MAESRISNFDFTTFAGQLGNVTQLNQFIVNITLPPFLAALFPESDQFARKVAFACRSSTVPSSTIGEIAVPFRGGRSLIIPGDRVYETNWEVTMRYDMNNIIGNTMRRWSDSIVGNVESDSVGSDENVLDYMGTGELYQLSRNGRIITEWKLPMIWPGTVSEPAFDWTSSNTIVEMPITFKIQHVETPVTRNNTISEELVMSGGSAF